ncbi:hypothetical protein ABVT39_014088 [Epinephelus coioides]
MFAQRQTYLGKAFLLLLLITAGRSAMLSNNLPTTAPPTVSISSLTTQLNNSSMEEPRVERSHRSCRSEHANYCENGGECMYPQDSDEPSCICTSSYSGKRCLFHSDHARTLPELEQLIGIIFGVAMFIIVLGILSYCFVYKRCKKSAPLIKSAASEISV